jgi:hypothetical protein
MEGYIKSMKSFLEQGFQYIYCVHRPFTGLCEKNVFCLLLPRNHIRNPFLGQPDWLQQLSQEMLHNSLNYLQPAEYQS